MADIPKGYEAVFSPKEAPPGYETVTPPKAESEQTVPWSTALGGAVIQSAPSLVENVRKMGEGLYGIASDPVAAAKGVGSLARGAESILGGPKEYTKNPVGVGKVDPMGQPITRMGMNMFKPLPRQETPEQQAKRAEIEAPAKAFWDEFSAPYKSMENFKTTLATDPARIFFDALSLGPGAFRKGAVSIAEGVAKTPIRIGATTVEHLTGAQAHSLKDAIRAGRLKEDTFLKNLNGVGDLEELVPLAQKGLDGMRKEQLNAYHTGLANGAFRDPAVLSFKDIESSLGAAEQKRWWKQFRLNAPSPGVEAEVNKLISTWKSLPPKEYHTAEGLDTLKKALNQVYGKLPLTERNAVDQRFVASSAAAVKKVIEQKFPGYAKVMKDYGEAEDAMDEIRRSMSLGDRATVDSGLRKLLSAYRNNANTNFGNRLRMVEKLEEAGAPGLRSALAGAQLGTAMPRGIGRAAHTAAALVNPKVLLAEPFLAPRLWGKMGYGVGAGQRTMEEMADIVLPKGVRDPLTKMAIPPAQKMIRFAPELGDFANAVLPERQE
jgi:hypothetical protein